MPFTFSHPAIVLPLGFLPRKWISLTGLVIGSMTPDFEYFIRMKPQSIYSHTISGIIWFDLPLAILVAFVFHHFVRNCLVQNLPKVIKSRLMAFTTFSWNGYFKSNWRVVVISILIGSASHLFWDSFTHAHGFFVGRIPGLNDPVQILGCQIPVFKILQHSSTLIGGIVILFALMKLPADESVDADFNFSYWSCLTLITLVIVALRILCGLDVMLYGHVIVTCISAFLSALVITPRVLPGAVGSTR